VGYSVGLQRFLKIVGMAIAVAVLVVGCGASGSSTADGEQGSGISGEWVSLPGTWAVLWGEGERGVVLAHGAAYDAASWEPQGQTLEENGASALAVEETSPSNLRTAIRYLKEESGVESVTLIGASAGARPVLEVGGEDPEKIDQLILVSGIGDVSNLGEYPKLFVASEGEGIAERVRQMADEAPGERNEALILPGDAHAQAIFQTEEGERLMQVILERIEEYG
jgi:pimeloyl-ACP methyl ester carboxylesterase